MSRPFVEIRPEHIGHGFFKAFGRIWPTHTFIGRIFPGDVGKRVYLIGDSLSVENDEQRDQRTRRNDGSIT